MTIFICVAQTRKAPASGTRTCSARPSSVHRGTAGPDRVDLNLDGLMVFIAGPPDTGTIPDGTPDPHYGLDHFGLRVENLDQTVATMKSKGAEFAVEPVQFRPDVKLAFVWAPDGVRIELLERMMA